MNQAIEHLQSRLRGLDKGIKWQEGVINDRTKDITEAQVEIARMKDEREDIIAAIRKLQN